MSSAKFCHWSTGLLKNVYLVSINSLRYRKSFYERNFPIFDRQFEKFAKQKLLFVKEFDKVFSALFIQQVCKGILKKNPKAILRLDGLSVYFC